MNIQIRVQVPRDTDDAARYTTDTDVALITDPEVVRDVLAAILQAEARIAARLQVAAQPVLEADPL